MESNRLCSKKGAWFIAVVTVSVFTWCGLASDLAAAERAENISQAASSAAKISQEKATEIAMKKVPGKVTSVEIEKKLGKKVYVVEILEKGSGSEVDVLVDMETGEVLGTER